MRKILSATVAAVCVAGAIVLAGPAVPAAPITFTLNGAPCQTT